MHRIGLLTNSALAAVMMAAETGTGSKAADAVPDPKFTPLDGRDLASEISDLQSRVSAVEARETPTAYDDTTLADRLKNLEEAHAAQLEYNKTLEDEIASYRQVGVQSSDAVATDDFALHIFQTYFREDFLKWTEQRKREAENATV